MDKRKIVNIITLILWAIKEYKNLVMNIAIIMGNIISIRTLNSNIASINGNGKIINLTTNGCFMVRTFIFSNIDFLLNYFTQIQYE